MNPESTMYLPTLALTLDNVRAAFDAGLSAIREGKTEFDLAKVSAVDSSAVATLLAWKRAAGEAGTPLRFLNVPPNLESLAGLYGVADLLHHH